MWQLEGFGFGNLARIKNQRGSESRAIIDLLHTQDRVAADVTRTLARVQSAASRVLQADRALRTGIIAFNGHLEGLEQTRRLGNVLVLTFRPQEAVYSLDLLSKAFNEYFTTVAEYNRAQFELFHALGYPAREIARFQPAGEVEPVDTDEATLSAPRGQRATPSYPIEAGPIAVVHVGNSPIPIHDPDPGQVRLQELAHDRSHTGQQTSPQGVWPVAGDLGSLGFRCHSPKQCARSPLPSHPPLPSLTRGSTCFRGRRALALWGTALLRIHEGYQGFGLGYHLGYGYGGDALGPGADGGYPFYGGPGYPHCNPQLRRIGGIVPFAYFGGAGYPTPDHPNFYGGTGELVPDRPVVSIIAENGQPVMGTNYGSFTGAVPNAEAQFAPFTARAAASPRNDEAIPVAVPICPHRLVRKPK